MKVSREKYAAIKRMTGSMDKVAAKFGVSCTTVRRIRGSLSYEAYKNGMKKNKSFTNATASGKKKAGSSSSTTKPKTFDKPKSNLNKDKYNKDTNFIHLGDGVLEVECQGHKEECDLKDGIKKIDPSDDIENLKWDLEKRESSLVERHDALIKDYVDKSEELDKVTMRCGFLTIVVVVLAGVLILMITAILS